MIIVVSLYIIIIIIIERQAQDEKVMSDIEGDAPALFVPTMNYIISKPCHEKDRHARVERV
jgi:hypothetical protein